MLGDHGITGKEKPYQSSVGVPLVISGPGIKKGIINTKPAPTLDITATLLDFAKIKIPSEMDSKSLKSYLETGRGYNRKYATSALGKWRMVFDGKYKLIDSKTDPIILYDLQENPSETINIAEQKPEIVRRLSVLLPPWTETK